MSVPWLREAHLARFPLALAVIVALAPAAASRADTFPVAAGDATSLQSALTQAAAHPNASGPDLVSIPAGTYSGAFTYTGDPVDVQGAGQATTTLTSGAAGSTTFMIDTPGSSFSGLSIENTATTYGFGLNLLHGGSVQDVTLRATGTSVSAVDAGGTTSVTRARVVLGPSDTGVHTSGVATMTISQMTLEGAGGGSGGIEADSVGASVHVSRLHSTGVPFPVRALFGGALTVRDSLIVLPAGEFATALDVTDNGNATNFTSTLDADRVTIVGDPGANQRGASAGANSAGDNFAVNVHDSVLWGVAKPLSCSASAGTSHASADWSSLPGAGDATSGAGCSTTRTNAVTSAPIFVDAAAGDYHQRYDSPLNDAGDPAPFAPTDDLDGLPRPVGRVDLGAYEYQRSTAADTTVTSTSPDSGSGAAPDRTAPTVTLLVKRRLSRAKVLRHGIRAIIGCSEACSYRASALLHKAVASRRISLAAAGTRTVTIKLTRRGRATLRRLGHVTLRVRATATDNAGNTGRARTRRITLVRSL